MKKIRKPLKLSRETLTSLNYGDLRAPAGMATLGCTTTGVSASTCAVDHTNCVGW